MGLIPPHVISELKFVHPQLFVERQNKNGTLTSPAFSGPRDDSQISWLLILWHPYFVHHPVTRALIRCLSTVLRPPKPFKHPHPRGGRLRLRYLSHSVLTLTVSPQSLLTPVMNVSHPLWDAYPLLLLTTLRLSSSCYPWSPRDSSDNLAVRHPLVTHTGFAVTVPIWLSSSRNFIIYPIAYFFNTFFELFWWKCFHAGYMHETDRRSFILNVNLSLFGRPNT